MQWGHYHYNVTQLRSDRTTESSELLISAVHYVHLVEIIINRLHESTVIIYHTSIHSQLNTENVHNMLDKTWRDNNM